LEPKVGILRDFGVVVVGLRWCSYGRPLRLYFGS
jgi:hypothetical protein